MSQPQRLDREDHAPAPPIRIEAPAPPAGDDIWLAARPDPTLLRTLLPVFGAAGLAMTVVGGLVPGLMALGAACVLTWLYLYRDRTRAPRLRFEAESISVAGFGRVPYRALKEAKVFSWASHRGRSAYLLIETYWPIARSLEVEADRTREKIWRMLEPRRIAVDLRTLDAAPRDVYRKLNARIGPQAAFSSKRPW